SLSVRESLLRQRANCKAEGSGSPAGRLAGPKIAANAVSRCSTAAHSGHTRACSSTAARTCASSSPSAYSTARSSKCPQLTVSVIFQISAKFLQLQAQFLSRAEQRILDRLFRSAQCFADGAQLQALVMLHLENHPLARGKLLESRVNPLANFFPEQ